MSRLDSDNASQYTQSSTPPTLKKRKSRLARRKVSMATRRRSQMLYLEKYGLNQPGWHQGSYDDDHNNSDHSDNKSDDSDNKSDHDNDNEDEQQISGSSDNETKDNDKSDMYNINRKSTTTIYYTEEPQEIITPTVPPQKQRPVSIRNYVQNNHYQKRPTRFIKPQKSNIDIMSFPATEFKYVHDLVHCYTEKVYMEGYLYKRNELNTNGVSMTDKKWTFWYAELCGPVLTLWTAVDDKDDEVYPQYINITDSTVEQVDNTTFSLNSAGSNRFLFQVQEQELLKKWILAIRLSCFECSKIQEIYTSTFIKRPQYNSLLSVGGGGKHIVKEGFIQVRFPGSTGWKRYWAKVSSENSKKKKMGGLFSSKKNTNNEAQQILFFESKKSKYPLMILNNVVQVYTIYPESPKLINLATLFKIEGNLVSSSSNKVTSASCLIMTSDTNELVKWLISLFDTFKLYGRPNTLLNDANNQFSLNFGDNLNNQSRLFLEVQDVVNIVDYRNNLLSNKKEFKAILSSKVLNGGRDRRISTNTTISAPFVQSPTQLRTVTSANSDTSDEEGVGESKIQVEDNSDSDSDESLFKLKRLSITNHKSFSTPTLLNNIQKPITPNPSKSSSEISSEVSSSSSSSLSYNNTRKASDKFLPIVQVVQHNSLPAETISSESNHFKINNTPPTKKKVLQPQHPQQPMHQPQQQQQQQRRSIMSTNTAPLYGSRMAASSASSVAGYNSSNNDYFSNQWETSSVDPRMMMMNNNSQDSIHRQHYHYASSVVNGRVQEEEDDEDDKPIVFTQNSLLYQHQQSRNKAQQKSSTATGGLPALTKSTSTPLRSSTAAMGPEKKKNTGGGMMDEHMILRERMMQQQYMIQQYMMQQQYAANGMMPMMMDPRMMQQQQQHMMQNGIQPQMMMHDSRFTYQQQQQQSPLIPTPSLSSGSYNRSRYYGGDNQSVSGASVASGGSNHNKRPNYKRQHVSSSASVTSASKPTNPSSVPPPAARRPRNY